MGITISCINNPSAIAIEPINNKEDKHNSSIKNVDQLNPVSVW